MKLSNLIFLGASFFFAVSMAVSNAYITNLKGAEIDAERFLEKGEDWASNGTVQLVVDSDFFIQLVGLYTRAGLDEFGMTLIGILLYYATIAFFITKLRLTINKPSTIAVFFLLVFSPSVLFRVAALLREPYTIFFVTFGVFLLSAWIVNRRSGYFIVGLAFCVVGALFHKAALALLPLIILLLMVCSIRFRPGTVVFVAFSVSLFSYLIYASLSLLEGLRGVQALTVILTGDFSSAEQIVSAKSSRDFRTTYDYGADWTSFSGVIVTVFKSTVYYYGKPFLNDLQGVSDFVAFFDNFLRWVVLYVVCVALYKNRFNNRQHVFLMGCYLLFNIIWAVGTSNYGTGSRHHMTSLPILALLYCLIFSDKTMRVGR